MFSINSLTVAPFVGGNSSGTVLVGGARLLPRVQRWAAYEAARRSEPSLEARTLEGKVLASTSLDVVVRMGFESNLVMWTLRVSAEDAASCPTTPTIEVAFSLMGLIRKVDALPWGYEYPNRTAEFDATVCGPMLCFADRHGPALAVFAWADGTMVAPSALPGGVGAASVHLPLAPHGPEGLRCSGLVRMAMAFGDSLQGVRQALAEVSGNFAHSWHMAHERWDSRWQSAFVPPERREGGFSGAFPVLETDDQSLRRLYYMSCLTLLSLMRWTPSLRTVSQRNIVTGAGNYQPFRFNSDLPGAAVDYVEVGGAAQFFWDASFHALLTSMLDPGMARNRSMAFLLAAKHANNWIDLMTGKTGGMWYSFNDYTVFQTILAHAALEPGFLEEHLPTGGTVADALRRLASAWGAYRMPESPCTADYGGDRNTMLEAVPTYIHAVPALQAANAWMMRTVARFNSTSQEDAARFRHEANCVVQSLFEKQFVEGGFWCSLYPKDGGGDSLCVEVRTCIDLLTIATTLDPEFASGGLARDGAPSVAAQMGRFAREELLTPAWLRALSREGTPSYVERPDHGTTGAYPAWPALVAQGLAVIDGSWAYSLEYLRNISTGNTWEGPFGQAHQLDNPDIEDPTSAGGSFKTARGATRYLADAGGAFAEVLVRGLFGYNPALALASAHRGDDLQALLVRPAEPRGSFKGKLRGVALPGGGRATITADPEFGLKITREHVP